MEVVITIEMFTEYVKFSVRGKNGIIMSGSDPLLNGCYDSILSNAVNRANEHCKHYSYEIVDFIFRKK